MPVTVETLRSTSGRRPFTVVELYLDSCTLEYGTSPCVAAIPATGTRKCYNTFGTCQDTPNYTNADKVYTFCSAVQVARLASTAFDAANALPCIKAVSFVPTQLDRKGGFAMRATVSVSLMDTTHNDSGVDKYVLDRPYDTSRGTFFSKLLARNLYYNQRKMIVKTGYLQPDGSVDDAGLQSATYFIDHIDGPDANGNVTIAAKDVLTFIDSDKVQLPKATTLSLSAALLAGATTVTIDCPDTVVNPLPSSGYFSVDSEVMAYAVTGSDATHFYCNLARAWLGTLADDHDAGSKVQDCYIMGGYGSVAVRVDSVMYQLLVDGGVPMAYIDHAGFIAEGDDWGLGLDVFGIVTSPTGVKDLVRDLAVQTGAYIWNDVRAQLVKFRLNRPALANEITNVDETYNIVEQSFTVKVDDAERLTKVYYWYGIIDPTKDLDKPENYRRGYGNANLEAGDPTGFMFRVDRIKNIFGKWMPIASISGITTVTDRLQGAYAKPQQTISMRLDAKDAGLWVADTLRVAARGFVDDTGAPAPKLALITESREASAGSMLQVVAQVSQEEGRYAIIMDDGSPDYDDPAAVHDPAGYICDDATLTMLPGDPYLIV